MELPKRIVERPSVVKLDGKRLEIMVPCDDGLTYPLVRLSALIGISRKALYYRLRKNGWRHPHILSGPVENGRRLGGGGTNNEPGNDEWNALSNRPRTRNLEKLRPLGTWEMEQL